MEEEGVLTWRKRGGVNVGEGENGGYPTFQNFPPGRGGCCENRGYIFFFHHLFSPMFSPMFFHHVKIGVVALLLLLFILFTFL